MGIKNKQIKLWLTCWLLCIINSAIAQQMFRGTADHNYNYNTQVKGAFNELAWKFYADAPVRSSITWANDAVYFGSSKGIFYSLNRNSGAVKWSFNTGSAINSSAAYQNGNVFFSDNRQVLYSLNASTGVVNWKTSLGQSKNYEWAFDYYYSSPTIAGDQLLIGSKDGFVYNINKANGAIKWKFKTGGVVRSTPAVADNGVYVGDTDGSLFAIDLNTGRQIWRFFTAGHGLNNTKFGYDRRAIIASPVVKGNKVFVGGRDGYFYAIDKTTGKQKWRVDHQISWVISSVAIKDSVLVTGTSDGHFVQALNINNGKQIWKYNTIGPVWSSPIIDGDKVYEAGDEGVLYCLNMRTGAKIDGFQVTRRIFSSPVIAGSLLYFGADDGYLYALKSSGKNNPPPAHAQKFVFFDNDLPLVNNGTSLNIKQYLVQNGYKVIGSKELIKFLDTKNSANNSVIVFATNYFPVEITRGNKHSLLRTYLNNGGKTVVLGFNPLVLKLDPKSKSLTMDSYLSADSVLGIKYGPDDLRSFRGHQPAFPTKTGKEWGLRNFWVADFSIPSNQVSIVLGSDENGLASAWVKKFNQASGSGFVQIWSDENKQDLSYITRVAEYGLK